MVPKVEGGEIVTIEPTRQWLSGGPRRCTTGL